MLDLNFIKLKLENSSFSNLYFFNELDSTNNYAIENNLPDMSVIIADRQINGRGRSSRVWESDDENNLYFSIILPKIEIKKLLPLNIIAGYALCDVIRKYIPETKLKWPNDILIKGKKVAGILIDVKFSGNNLSKIVIGIGINVNMKNIPDNIKDIATSISLNYSKNIKREEVLFNFLLHFDEYFNRLINDSINIEGLWRYYSVYLNKNIQIHIGDTKQKFIEKGINVNGGLIVEDISGKLSEIYTGDIGYDFCC